MTDTSLVNSGNKVGCYQVSFVSAFGSSGKYGALTNVFSVVVQNPCEKPAWRTVGYGKKFEGTLVTGSASTALISVSGGAAVFTFEYPVVDFTDATGQVRTLGDGYSICGPMKATVLTKTGLIPVAQATGKPSDAYPFITLTANTESNSLFSARNFTVKFQTTSVFDYGLYDFYFALELQNYPSGGQKLESISV